MTEWEIFEQARTLYDGGDCDGALRVLEEARPGLAPIRSHVACLEAACRERKGERRLALQLLEQEISTGTDNYWVFYQNRWGLQRRWPT